MRLQVFVVGLFDRFEAAHAGPHHHRDPVGVRLGDDEPGVAHGLHAGDDPVLHEGIHAAGVLGTEVRFEIEVADFTAEMDGKARRVESRDRRDAALPPNDRLPRTRDVVADR